MQKTVEIIKRIAERSGEVMLFHSGSGKDSIALLDLCYPYFDRIVCVYMYVVPDLGHINRYINYACRKYPKIEFIQVPHYGLFSYYKTGYLGCEKRKIRQYTLAQLTDILRQKYSIEWACYGFKQSDGMNRRLMLRTYEQNAVCEKTKKFFPLSEYKNSDVLSYIQQHGLIMPERYGKTMSSGTNISNIDYLLFLRENHPQDLKKVIAEFPMVERILFEYDYKTIETERDAHD